MSPPPWAGAIAGNRIETNEHTRYLSLFGFIECTPLGTSLCSLSLLCGEGLDGRVGAGLGRANGCDLVLVGGRGSEVLQRHPGRGRGLGAPAAGAQFPVLEGVTLCFGDGVPTDSGGVSRHIAGGHIC